MKLGKKDSSGRRRPVKIEGSEFSLEFDTIIPAIGQETALDYLTADDLKIHPDTNETSLPSVFAGGDLVRGASSVIHAVGDGRKAALNIIQSAKNALEMPETSHSLRYEKFYYQKNLAFRKSGITTPHLSPNERINFDLVTRTLTKDEAIEEAERCLLCDDVCDICVSVCPNLSNMSFTVIPKRYPVFSVVKSGNGFKIQKADYFHLTQEPQIINIGDFCNECGNCTTFCPTSGDPFKVKPLFYLTKESFDSESHGYWLNGRELVFKSTGKTSVLREEQKVFRFLNYAVEVTMDKVNFDILSVKFLNRQHEAKLFKVVEMIILYENLQKMPIFQNNIS